MDIVFLQNLCGSIMSAQRTSTELMLRREHTQALSKSSRRDVVTDCDKQVQSLLAELLSETLPDAVFVQEESVEQPDACGEHVFIIDPIDGTMNFVHGYDHSAISVAYAHRGELLCGCVYNPYRDEMFSAIKNQGAFLNGKPIHVDNVPLGHSLFCLGTSPYYPELWDETFRLARLAFEQSLDLRRMGTASLDMCAVAAGRAGLFLELRLSLWDYAAGSLIVREAGGLACDIGGRPLGLEAEKSSVLAASPRALEDFLRLTGRLDI